MANKRPADFDLRRAVVDPGFTPRVGDASALLELMAEGGTEARAAERALLRLGEAAVAPAIARAGQGSPAERAAALRWLGRLASESAGEGTREGVITALLGGLGDEDARARRAAAGALGKAAPTGVGEALASALDREQDASVKRALLEALGKVGGEAATRAIAEDTARADPATARERSRAAIMAARGAARATPSVIEAGRAPEKPTRVALYCRAGLEQILKDELPAVMRAEIVTDPPGAARVCVTLRGALGELHERSRTFVDLTFPLSPVRFSGDGATAAIIASLTSPEALTVMRRFTSGPLRFRIAFRGGGKRRAAVWQIAEEVATRAPELINDPTESPWEARVHEGLGVVRVELAPAIVDPRFTYRLGDVPAASHPTIAAALARMGGVREDDVVWDPFVGSGTELCERAKAGPYWRLVGSDIDARALSVARENLAAAGVRDALLLEGDAAKLVLSGPAPTLILSNPPLGRRVQRSSALAPLLDRFVAHAAAVLAPGGRLAWISPFPRRTEEMAAQKGLSLSRSWVVDMGGFSAEMQLFVK